MKGKLSTYRAKRDFTKTAEPSGSAIRKAEYPRFVIQKHDATRLHYDLRLELDGVFKSWAVTKGPSLDPADKRLAVEVEDHPLDYGDFEGTIPNGQYGGGTVMLWDRGFWVPEDGKPAEQSLRDGELKFLLAGEKMQGGWVLVRMKRDRDGGSRNNWLLIKHKDEGAHPGDKDKLLENDHSVASGRSMEEIAAGKGRGPTPFMLARRKVKPNAIWNSNKSEGGAASALSSTSKTRTKARPRQRSGKAASGGGKASSISEGNVVLGIKISNPDKELWPASADGAAVTKIELARYIADVGPWMIDHVKGRPCSVIRAPDGIDGQQFFQRHAGPGTPDVVKEVRVSGDRKAYIQIDTVEGLVAMAQMAALEFHPWNSAPGNPSMPGRLVFDLDPGPDVPFSMTVKAAKELRTRLDDLGLVSFCKTTGGKGLHVVTPLKTGRSDEVDWDRAKMFAQTVCAQMAHDEPGLYVTNMAKKLRTGRIFLDYLRNDSTATAVAPLSPRARPGATVSMPLTWAQVREDLDPKRFTIRTVPALLAGPRPGRITLLPRARSKPRSSVSWAKADGGSFATWPQRTRKTRSKAPVKEPKTKRAPLPNFVEPCLATLVDSVPEGPLWVHEIKFDGYRLQARIEGDDVRLLTRKGLDWTHRFSALRDALCRLNLGSALIDGEAVVEDASGHSSFSQLVEVLGEGGRSDEVVFYAFDLLHFDGVAVRDAPLADRKRLLKAALGPRSKSAQVRYSERLDGDGEQIFTQACALGLEGIISKRSDRPYRSGRNGDWVKTKCIQTDEFVIVGYLDSNPNRNAIGALVVGYYDRGRLVYCGRVGTGYSVETAHALWTALQPLRVKTSELSAPLTALQRRGVKWVAPQLVAQINYRAWTGDGLLRHASFIGLREDKPAADVRRPSVKSKFSGS